MQLWGQRIRLVICQDGRGSEKLRGLVVELGRVKGGIVVGQGGVKGGINGRQYLHFGAPPLLHLAIYLNDLFKA